MTSYDHFIRLLVLGGFMATGLLLTMAASFVLLVLSGMSLEEIQMMGESGGLNLSPGLTRMLVIAQHLLTFVIPGLVFGLIFFQAKFMVAFDLARKPGWVLCVLGIVFLMASYPLVNLTFVLNEAIPIPSWATNLESQAEETLKAILHMPTPMLLLVNILIIGVLPGIGEELIFRGIVQKQTALMIKNPVAAIWIAAFIFSAIHFQFEGFLPRMALGAVLGYLYYWTGNLWVPIVAHAFNNGIQVVLVYFTGVDIETIDETSSDILKWWLVPVSLLLMYLLYKTITKTRGYIEQA